MSVAYHLENYPTLNQNKEDPQHEYPDVNAGMDCVPTSIASALTWYTGTQYYGDEIIDAVYGPRYLGGTAAQQYIDYCQARGIKLWHIDGNPVQLVDAIVRELQAGIPCLVTVPGHWNDPNATNQNPGSVTHVMVTTGYDSNEQIIEVMNPWTGNFEEYSFDWFHVKLCYNQIWPLESELSMVPTGPTYTVTAGHNNVPTSGNAVAQALGLTWNDLCSIPGNEHLKEYDPTGPYLFRESDGYGVSFLVPGWPSPVPAPVPSPIMPDIKQDIELANANVQAALANIQATLLKLG